VVSRVRRKLCDSRPRHSHLNLSADSYFDPGCGGYVRDLFARRSFDVVIASYIFYSKLFESVPAPTRKLIDTHDVFSDRYRLYREHGQAREFFSTTRTEEGRALDRADAILAIQEWDAAHFRSLTRAPVTVVGHLAPPIDAAAGAESRAPVMLFVGGPMGINVHGMEWFIENVLPLVRRQVPEAELWLAGGIADRVRSTVAGVRRCGFVDVLEDVYRRAAVVINPQRFGTGVSIKSVDALRFGRPLVTTESGGRGLEDGAGTAFVQAGSAEEFAGHLVGVLRNPELGSALAERALEYARRYYQRSLQALADVVRGAAG
jgi:glycosyltransferase involved in cell wall biosynthesis